MFFFQAEEVIIMFVTTTSVCVLSRKIMFVAYKFGWLSCLWMARIGYYVPTINFKF